MKPSLADSLAVPYRPPISSSTSTTTPSGSWTTTAQPWHPWASVSTLDILYYRAPRAHASYACRERNRDLLLPKGALRRLQAQSPAELVTIGINVSARTHGLEGEEQARVLLQYFKKRKRLSPSYLCRLPASLEPGIRLHFNRPTSASSQPLPDPLAPPSSASTWPWPPLLGARIQRRGALSAWEWS